MASLMFRAKADNRFYAETKRPRGAGTWYVFYYDLRGKKVRLRVGSNPQTAELAKRDWEPKDREARTIPLHGRLKAVLRDLKSKSDSRYVFGHGEKPCPNKLLPRLHRVCRMAGIPPITVHNLRDEFASHLVMRGVGIETVCRLLGHSDIKITWDHYIHLAPQKIKEALERLDWGQTTP